MLDHVGLRAFLTHSDWANDQLVQALVPLSNDQLDQAFDIGLGSARRTLLHIWAGESVWLQRWQGRRDTPWPDETEKTAPAAIGARLRGVSADRTTFLQTLKNEDASRLVVYRDSKGSLYQASLGDMMIQGVLHSAHHRAQAVNILRRLGVAAPELDYMYHVRASAAQ